MSINPVSSPSFINFSNHVPEETVHTWIFPKDNTWGDFLNRHVWHGDGNVSSASLIRSGDELQYEIVRQFGRPKRGLIPLPEGLPIADGIAYLISLEPVVGDDNSIEFRRADQLSESQLRITETISQLDPDTIVDENK